MAEAPLGRGLKAAQLYDACQRRLQLSWLVPPPPTDRLIPAQSTGHSAHNLISHYNPIHSRPIQVLDHAALSYLSSLKKNSFHDALEQLCAPPTAVIVLADTLAAPPILVEQCQREGIALLGSPLGGEELVAGLGYYLSNKLAASEILHGVFLEVMGIGVLLCGDSGIGKSELALELISRGQRLVADDAPIIRRQDPDTLIGHCPPLLQDYLEVRGLGLMDIRAMFGDSAVKRELALDLMVRLVHGDHPEASQIDRLYGSRQQRELLGVSICEITLPVAPGRNLAVLIEAAVRSHILYTNGEDPVQAFIQRQRQGMHGNTP